MVSKITFFLLLALVIACATMVSVPTAEAKDCTTTTDCPILLCKIEERGECVDNQCKCDPIPQIHGQSCRTTQDCDATICDSLLNKCVDGSCTCTR
ncbi:hypothetical protein N665_2127s0004 [Sinapis alba]|nr:hypothetical protein N665_2127s0004 [Sinapis alba]